MRFGSTEMLVAFMENIKSIKKTKKRYNMGKELESKLNTAI
ncbi:hypothetical protein [Dehalobacter restrictus]|jgi:hypothetical protein|uniref:Transposase n=1 Tax=Dehalobacter restrictus (strain DSM 9455 / PER-K23) TaxID=871738 RepID=A0ABN4C1T7_DEHRP|nr:hypothetical protein [Dehalobacter restrictus]AHF11283.1 hypothetical protein DEHRE_03970 [Dehalobacter restrictus DSM 9455]